MNIVAVRLASRMPDESLNSSVLIPISIGLSNIHVNRDLFFISISYVQYTLIQT